MWITQPSTLWTAVGIAVLALPARAPAAEEALTFEKHVRPILKAHCFHCHGEEEKPKAKLDLRLVRWMQRGGKGGPAVVPGNLAESLLWTRIEAGEMPPGDKKLSPQDRATIQNWITQGSRTARPEPETLPQGEYWTEEERGFWSFQPIRRPAVPLVRDAAQVRTPVDAFLLERLEAKQLRYGAGADRRTLIRRLFFDLLGLPPTPAEVEAFVTDARPDAYEQLVDRLLESPRYGERWARHWLDVAGYADSDGYTPRDPERKHAWRYRDYLIQAFNSDRPWDALIREQLAGDELLTPPYGNAPPTDHDKLIATGFLRMAPDGSGDPAADQNQARNDVVAETIKIVSTSLLGLTVGCAQCHDHRYDPISQADYYRLRAIFEPALDWKNWRNPNARLVSLWSAAERKRAAEVDAEIKRLEAERLKALQELVEQVLEKELAQAPAELREQLRAIQKTPAAKRTPEQQKLLKDHPRVNVTTGNVNLYDRKSSQALLDKYGKLIESARARRPAEKLVQAMTEIPGKVSPTVLFARGDFNLPKQEVKPAELSVLGATAFPVDDPKVPTTGRRLAYARHLTSGQHPLVARVLVNRIWHHHFGRGLVGTPADFGALGDRPTHPELLDWLADEFMRAGWRWKPLHRLILNSTAYRQSSLRRPELEAVDPDNRLLGRMSIRRLEAEVVRDSLLAVSGRLHPKMHGPPVPVTPDEVGQVIVGVDTRDTAGRPTGRKVSLEGEEFRRSLYVQVRRSLPLSMLETFDAPLLNPNCELRSASTVAPQSLLLMNNELVIQQSEEFARQVIQEAGADVARQIQLAWRRALTQEPTAQQVADAQRFVERQHARLTGANANLLALTHFCHALVCSNAFLYVD